MHTRMHTHTHTHTHTHRHAANVEDESAADFRMLELLLAQPDLDLNWKNFYGESALFLCSQALDSHESVMIHAARLLLRAMITDLDRVSHEVYLTGIARARAHVDAETPDNDGGELVRDIHHTARNLQGGCTPLGRALDHGSYGLATLLVEVHAIFILYTHDFFFFLTIFSHVYLQFLYIFF